MELVKLFFSYSISLQMGWPNDDKVVGWGWLNDDVSKKYTRKKTSFACAEKKGWNFLKKTIFYAVTFL